ncbi:MAG: hypothetical protein FWE70_00985 [Oscillospiraceae bacterium]|nr:hypothetical protein [Oscillospiraceae bacterium]
MEKRERLERVFSGREVDRPPMIGGWIANPRGIVEIAGATEGEYLADPEKVAIKAYRDLGMDGVIGLFLTKDLDSYRVVDADCYQKADKGIGYDEMVRQVEALPDPEEYVKNFDFDGWYRGLKRELTDRQAKCGDMVYMQAFWGAGGRLSFYADYGYENFFLLFGLRPDLAARLIRHGSGYGRCMSTLMAMAVRDGLMPKAVLLGEDICDQRGCMVSVEFLEEHYGPALEYGLQPLLDAGVRPVWHCDGDVRRLLPMLIRSGIKGFQGFQPECGMLVEEIAGMRDRDGGRLLIFGPFSVTTELIYMTPDGIRARARHYVDACKGRADLAIFTSNTICPDVPVENILAMYDEISRYRY